MSDPTFYPNLDNVLVRRKEKPTKSAGGILLPAGSVESGGLREGTAEGQVLSVGPGARYEGKSLGMALRPGDTVYFSPHRAFEVELNGEKLLVVGERDCVGYVRCVESAMPAASSSDGPPKKD